MGDFCDGDACKSHPLFSKDQQALQILLYYDDLEVTNPLGSHTKVHKLGKIMMQVHVVQCVMNHDYNLSFSAVFYYTLANISPQYRSSLNTIQLLTLVKSAYVSKYGVDQILQPFMDDLALLEKVNLNMYIFVYKLLIIVMHYVGYIKSIHI